MLIKNLENNNISSLENCESEPIHIPGSIQPFGVLLGVRSTDYSINYCSENCHVYFNYSHKEMLGKRLIDFFDNEQMEAFSNYCCIEPSTDTTLPFIFKINETQFNTTIHQNDEIIILEFEPYPEHDFFPQKIFVQAKKFAAHIETAKSLVGVCKHIADEIREITGYDRVMVYQFDEDYNGEVLAESIKDDIQPWLGLHYPHTDIPAQARELYLRNLLRMIVDVAYVPVPIYTMESADGLTKNLDLSNSLLRSVSPIHIEYLKNMGSAATLSMSLLHNKKLWGLISCHHSSPKVIPYLKRLDLLVHGFLLTSQIDVRHVADTFEMGQTIEQHLKLLLKKLSVDRRILLEDADNDLFLNPLRADGAIVAHGGTFYRFGTVPDNKSLYQLFKWLGSNCPSGFYCTNRLVDDYPTATAFQHIGAGILYYSMGISEEQCVVWFRKETITKIRWAGDPGEAMRKNGAQQWIQPRKSFETWQQTLGQQSLAWKNIEIQAAEKIVLSLERRMHINNMQQQEENYILLNEKLQLANLELRNSRIHVADLQEPLFEIQKLGALATKKEAGGLLDNEIEIVRRMNESAQRMQFLIDDLLINAKKITGNESLRLVNLNEMLALIKIILVQDEAAEQDFTLTIDRMPIINGYPFQLNQLFVNLLDNALKFKRKDISLAIDIFYHNCIGFTSVTTGMYVPGDFYCISIADNGIGFTPSLNQSIFQPWLHPNPEEQSSLGVGLAICKKIMNNHNGYIDAEGSEGSTVFRLYFPV